MRLWDERQHRVRGDIGQTFSASAEKLILPLTLLCQAAVLQQRNNRPSFGPV